MFMKAAVLLQRLHSSTTHWIQQSVYWICDGTQRNTAKRLYTGTQCVVVVTSHSDKMLCKAHIWRCTTVQGNTRCVWCSCSPWACTRMVWRLHSCSYEKFCKVAAKKKIVQNDSFDTTDDAVPHWPSLDVCRPRRARNLNSRRLHCRKCIGGKIRRPSLWSKGTVSGSVLFSGRWPGRWCSFTTATTL